MPDDLPTLSFPDVPSFAAWLAEHHASAPGMWLMIPKRGGNGVGPTNSQALITKCVEMCHRGESP